MKKLLPIFFLLALLAPVLLAQEKKEVLVIFEAEFKGITPKPVREAILTDAITAELADAGIYNLVDRDTQYYYFKQIQGKSDKPCEGAECIADLAAGLDADLFIKADISKAGGECVFTAKLYRRKPQTVLYFVDLTKTANCPCQASDLQKAAHLLGKKLAGREEGNKAGEGKVKTPGGTETGKESPAPAPKSVPMVLIPAGEFLMGGVEKFSGLGLEIKKEDGEFARVKVVRDGSPAFLAGLKADDQIITIMNLDTKSMSLPEVAQHLRGLAGSGVVVKILRTGFSEPRDFMVVRGEIPAEPPRKVFISAFEIDKYEVTINDYARCVQAGSCNDFHLKGVEWPADDQRQKEGRPYQEHKYCNWGKLSRSGHPLNCVDWNQARDYCAWTGKRLPTEAEWEKAARGTDGRTFVWGEAWPPPPGSGNFADLSKKKSLPNESVIEGYDDGYGSTAPGCAFPNEGNQYGLCDMAGNVSEWVQDWYDNNYYRNSPAQNPTGPVSGGYRVARGAGWLSYGRDGFILFSRGALNPTARTTAYGFRCARNAK